MEFFNCSPGFLERCHLDEREPFRALGILVANHLSVAYLADPIEEIEQVAFAGVERKVTYIKLRRGNLDQFRLTTDFLFRSAILTLSLGGFGRVSLLEVPLLEGPTLKKAMTRCQNVGFGFVVIGAPPRPERLRRPLRERRPE